MLGGQALTVLLLTAVAYLIYKVHRLERLLDEGRTRRRASLEGDGKVIPILKENIEPGPFKGGRRSKGPPDKS